MSLIDASYFVGEIEIPNSTDQPVAERIALFIQKYEPLFLQKLFGYALYKEFVAGIMVIPPATPDIKWINLLYGAEYTDFRGELQKWKGLIVTDTPIFNIAGGYVYRKPEYLTAGISIGFPAGVNTVTFDGTAGAPDWRGWTPILTRTAPMKPGIDYSWDPDTGIWTLLIPGDKFNNNEDFRAEFEIRTDATPSLGVVPNESCIANYVYYWYRKACGTQSTGIGEVITKAENADNTSPRKKMAKAWNDMRCSVQECLAYLQQNADTYPEWTNNNKIGALRYFSFVNPIY